MIRLRPLALVVALCLPAVAAAPAAAQDPSTTLVVGDSLAVGMLPTLQALLPGSALAWDVRSGRTTPQGLRALRVRLGEVAPTAVVVSLGTNDGPDPGRFADRLHRVLAAIPPTACVIWPSIVRPPRKGDETGLNRVLRRVATEDARLVVVEWERAVSTGRVVLPDGLHPDAAGYLRRSRMVAAAARRGCAPATSAPVAPATGAPVPPQSGGAPAP